MGIDIEIDDFGSGHASLIGLARLRPKCLKLDRQLVTDIVESEEQRCVVSSIIDIAKALNVGVIAEGVETEGHAEALTQLGCDMLQGYALGYPMPAAEIGKFISPAGRTPARSGAGSRMLAVTAPAPDGLPDTIRQRP
jgi:EAL domain-containing protein (putative c-di-GMP-specific phosphodiesterase class I)